MERSEHKEILEEGGRMLEAGDVSGYWTLMATFSDYAKLAGEIARGHGFEGSPEPLAPVSLTRQA